MEKTGIQKGKKIGTVNTGALVVEHHLRDMSCYTAYLRYDVWSNISACITVQMSEGPCSNLCFDTIDIRKIKDYAFTNFLLAGTSYPSVVVESPKQHKTTLIVCANTDSPIEAVNQKFSPLESPFIVQNQKTL